MTPDPAAAPPPFRQVLPNLAAYRAEFVEGGAKLPLPPVPWSRDGLLAALPAPPEGRRGWPWNIQTTPPTEPAAGWPKITIVTPSFKQGVFLEETLRSVLLQNYPDLEFIVMDGGSPDTSPAVIERYRPWLSFARVQRDRGQSHAINLGFSLGSGEIHGWINSDDFYLPGALHRVALAWLRGVDFVYGDGLELDEVSGNMLHTPAALARGRYVKFPGQLLSHATFWSAARHQPLWEEQHCALDYELWIRLLPGLRTRHVNQPLAVARRHEAAKTSNPAMKRQWTEDAARNGLAHPEIYQANPWLDREYRLVQKCARRWRARGETAKLEALRAECGWTAPIVSGG